LTIAENAYRKPTNYVITLDAAKEMLLELQDCIEQLEKRTQNA
jgi:hypothetical protein